MDIDFPLVLVLLTFGTGLIWLFDSLFLKRAREEAFAAQPPGAGNQEEADGPKEPWLTETARSFFPVLALVLVLRSFLIEPFQIPSGSMRPTLEVGDFILVNKYTYGLRLPVLGTKVLAINDPQRGDIMVFKYPEDEKTNYIKRVIGLPGDKITYRDKQLYLNDELVKEERIDTVLIREPNFNRNLPFPVHMAEETIGEITHKIYEHTSKNPESEGEWMVPEDSYFVIGDNRDNSRDGRFWGFVKDELVVGRAFAIWMQWECLTCVPSFSRVGGIE